MPGDRFRDRMLHLDAGIDFDEVKLAGLVHQELDGAGVGVADAAHGLAQSGRSFLRAAAGLTAGEGASSSSFWCRRWMEHSRSPRISTLPC